MPTLENLIYYLTTLAHVKSHYELQIDSEQSVCFKYVTLDRVDIINTNQTALFGNIPSGILFNGHVYLFTTNDIVIFQFVSLNFTGDVCIEHRLLNREQFFNCGTNYFFFFFLDFNPRHLFWY